MKKMYLSGLVITFVTLLSCQATYCMQEKNTPTLQDAKNKLEKIENFETGLIILCDNSIKEYERALKKDSIPFANSSAFLNKERKELLELKKETAFFYSRCKKYYLNGSWGKKSFENDKLLTRLELQTNPNNINVKYKELLETELSYCRQKQRLKKDKKQMPNGRENYTGDYPGLAIYTGDYFWDKRTEELIYGKTPWDKD